MLLHSARSSVSHGVNRARGKALFLFHVLNGLKRLHALFLSSEQKLLFLLAFFFFRLTFPKKRHVERNGNRDEPKRCKHKKRYPKTEQIQKRRGNRVADISRRVLLRAASLPRERVNEPKETQQKQHASQKRREVHRRMQRAQKPDAHHDQRKRHEKIANAEKRLKYFIQIRSGSPRIAEIRKYENRGEEKKNHRQDALFRLGVKIDFQLFLFVFSGVFLSWHVPMIGQTLAVVKTLLSFCTGAKRRMQTCTKI